MEEASHAKVLWHWEAIQVNSEREEEHGVRRGPVGHAHFSLIVKYLSITSKKLNIIDKAEHYR